MKKKKKYNPALTPQINSFSAVGGPMSGESRLESALRLDFMRLQMREKAERRTEFRNFFKDGPDSLELIKTRKNSYQLINKNQKRKNKDDSKGGTLDIDA